MIQRIQSIYLLLAAILMAVSILCPLLDVVYTDQFTSLYARGLFVDNNLIKPTWGILFINVLSIVIILISIFTFKNRKRQINLVKIAIFCSILLYITIGVYIYLLAQFAIDNYHFTIICPVIAIILEFMAISKIIKDEKLVKSLNRIR